MKYLSMAALALVGVMTTGCSSENDLTAESQETKLVTLTTTINLDGGAQTRSLDAAGHKTFANGDQISVIYKNTSGQTKPAGVQLAASDISADGKTATISVTMNDPAENSQLRLIYPAIMTKTPIATDATIDDANTIDYYYLQHSQNGYLGTLGDGFDLAVFDGTMNGDQLPASITLENKLAICAFTLKDDKGTPETTDDEDITSHITNLTVNDGTDTYTIGRSVGVGPLYVAMKPVTAALTFTATDEDGQHYTKTLSSKSFAANNIYPIGMKMVKSYKTYSTLPVGTLLKLGDQIDLSTNVHINSVQWVETSKAPFTLVRANVVGETVTEAVDGTHYVLKDKDGGFHLQENNFLVSEASDGLFVASYNQPNNSYVCCTHVNLAAITINNLPTDDSYPNKKYYTAHTYDFLYGTLNGDVKLILPSGAAVWLGGMTHHAGEYVSGIECQGTATINLVEGTTNDLTLGNEYAYNGIDIKPGTLTIDGTGTLLASGGGNYAGIGGYGSYAHIVIDGGNITATGGYNAAGIGSDHDSGFGDITINGGNVTTTGGGNAAGIGCGFCGGGNSSCGDITFNGGTVVVNAGANFGWGVGLQMGSMDNYSCGDIKFVGGNVTVNGNITTKSSQQIYVNGVSQGYYITASAQSPFVYTAPVTP